MKVCLRKKSFAQVEVLLDSMPFVFIQLAAAEKLDRRARSNRDICDNEAGMVSRQMVMDGVRQDPESIVEKVDEDEKNKDEKAELTAGSHLISHQYTGSGHYQVLDLTMRLVILILQYHGGPVEDTSAN